ncbi:MAG: phenylalanine 4-monooxygenase [Bdellovibrionaceae bacterium]|nr:phenylalanine 4-monooxygenase [Bdellovibrionales bacterium]MCB9255266.1 phenylalanine 4-monooxygenase [Pseudobdellovibrionaceae bacterium]
MIQALRTQQFRKFDNAEHQAWRTVYKNLEACRDHQAFLEFNEGLAVLGIGGEGIPDLDAVNARLMDLTGWRAVPVDGLEGGNSFYPALARREYPIGNFIRSATDLGYTPAPDVIHDLYGHIPLLANTAYADFCQRYAATACKYLEDPTRFDQFERFFWFTVEFGLVETEVGRRIFGAGILSSKAESDYALSEAPEVLDFSIEAIVRQDYRIDQFQHRLFLLRSPEQLYESLADVEACIKTKDPFPLTPILQR